MSGPALNFLSSLEEREARLLCWGYVDGGFRREEVVDLAERWALRHDTTGRLNGDSLVADLERSGLLLEVDTGRDVLHRTRMAETVRLAARLRQLFPSHGTGSNWTTAPKLVSDYRLTLRSRSYPRRDVDPDETALELSSENLNAQDLEQARRLLAGRGTEFRLSRFQVDSARAVLRGMKSGKNSGTIVSAGTGAGKSLAFYLPALAHVAARPEGTRVLALYPRIELLRDQLAATFGEARALDAPDRTLRIGALYGATPHTAKWLGKQWRRMGSGHICPFMRCPACSDGDLIWREEDRSAGRESLICFGCQHTIGEEQIALTRSSLRRRPVDVLFTTTEMLNRSMADGGLRPLVGIGPRAQPIDLMLLDEVHTYEGSTGAHVAHLLRRWRHSRRRPVHFVGLSATLRDATGFFASLTGLHDSQVTGIEPRPADMVSEGQEYLLALRADPTSGTGVLSTSIQTAMLLQRALDPLDTPVSGGAFGQRLFAFTDDLDVVNRFYFDLLDAEGLDSYGRPRTTATPLASLRLPDEDLAERRGDGQSWEALRSLGHRFDADSRTNVSRTTSQDAGVDRNASAVIATASLEVGFDDDRVGAVLQHKAPRGAAAFLQRKGRAGRTRTMRPWTVVTLSDGGRDRLAYQRYEDLFDPELAARTLPVFSPTILRMQAVYVLTDWLTERLGGHQSTWAVLQKPITGTYKPLRDYRDQTLRLLKRVLSDSSVREELGTRIQRVLGIDAPTAEAILWEAPRPLLTSVVPTAIRRLEQDWTTLDPPGVEATGDGPLPEFVVSRLFGDLHLPEVTVISPSQQRGGEDEATDMPIVLALGAYAPGRVSHRLTVGNRFARHWVAPPDPSGDLDELAFEAFCPTYEDLGLIGHGPGAIRLVRPTSITVQQPDEDIKSSSHGRLVWERQITPTSEGTPAEFVQAGHLAELASEIRWHLHADRREVLVRRWAHEVEVDTRSGAGDQRRRVAMTDADGRPVGLGFDATVDGLALSVTPPDSLLALDGAHLRALRSERLRHLIVESTLLDAYLNQFDRQRLAQALQAALVHRAVARGTDLGSAFAEHRDDVLVEVARILDQSGPEADLDRKGARRIGQALEVDAVREQIAAAAEVMWDTPDESWRPWLQTRWCATVGGLIHRALQDLCSEFDSDDVVLEIDQASGGPVTLWLLETAIGGSGLLQAAAQRIVDDPRGFVDLVFAGLLPSPQETVASELEAVADLLSTSPPLGEAFARVREASDNGQRQVAFDALLAHLREAGVFACHPVVSALSARYLRPGAGPASDRLTNTLIHAWAEHELRLGVEIDLPAFARLQADNEAVDAITGGSAPQDRVRGWRVGQVQGMLWQRGVAARRLALTVPNRFAAPPPMDQEIVNAQLDRVERIYAIEEAGELTHPEGPLARSGDAVLRVMSDELGDAKAELLKLMVEPIETGALLDHARVQNVRRSSAGVDIGLVLDLAV